MDLLSNLGVLADGRGDYEAAFQRYDSALKISQETGYKDGEIVFLSNRGSELVALGRYEESVSDLRQAIGLAGINGSWVMPQTFNAHAEALLHLERYDEAFYSARQSLVLSEEDKTPETIGMAWRTLGMIAGRMGNPVHFSDWETHQQGDYNAEVCFANSLKIFTDEENVEHRARTLREWARYKLRTGERENGEKMWREAQELFATLGAQREVERMKDLPQ
jgi:tetratricopeptide (TPR) repeat protein